VANDFGDDTVTRTDYIDVREVGAGGDGMHVADLDCYRVQSGRKYYVYFKVVIEDGDDAPVSNAMVTIHVTEPLSLTGSAATGADGSVLFSYKTADTSTFCFEVTDVTHAELEYEPEYNLMTSTCEGDSEFDMPADISITTADGEKVAGIRCGTVDNGVRVEPTGVVNKAIIPVEIPVAFHSLYYSQGRGTYGVVTDQQIYDQIDVLNAAYAGTGISFKLQSIDRTENKTWCQMSPGSSAEVAAKQALAVDPAHTLNIYSCYPKRGLLGWSYFPYSYSEDHYMHGTVVHFGSLPDGYLSTYNEGDTATHEIGHYCGLYHTFQGGCSEPNDHCDDTPQEATPDYYCVEGRDTCSAPGLDPIHNYMDYTPDACMYEFTPDQANRMAAELQAYRPSLFGASAPQPDQPVVASASGFTGISPNPFNPMTKISFYLNEKAGVSLKVYDLKGRMVNTLVDGTLSAGSHDVNFDGRGLASSVYFMVLETSTGLKVTERMMLIK
jgi:hypothetical protein